MLTQYIDSALKRAHYEILEDDKSFFGEVKECEGVYANAKTLEECRKELEQTLEDWILLRVSKNLPLPQIDGIDLSVKEVA
jgi:predicted RNase H-like HicB family nuclease